MIKSWWLGNQSFVGYGSTMISLKAGSTNFSVFKRERSSVAALWTPQVDDCDCLVPELSVSPSVLVMLIPLFVSKDMSCSM